MITFIVFFVFGHSDGIGDDPYNPSIQLSMNNANEIIMRITPLERRIDNLVWTGKIYSLKISTVTEERLKEWLNEQIHLMKAYKIQIKLVKLQRDFTNA